MLEERNHQDYYTYFGFENADQFCFQFCVSSAFALADNMCAFHGDENNHVQVQTSWHY